jgi:hypothetical protein
MVRFVTIAKFCELTGFTAAAVYTRKCKGIWPEGSVWRYEPGTKKIMMDLQSFDRWIETGHPSQSFPAPAMKSLSLPDLYPPQRRAKRSPLRPKLDT